jgi:hypothetical protein
MAGNKLTLKLTGDQQKQIKDATGKSISELNISLAGAGSGLSNEDLDKVAGGAVVDYFLKLDSMKNG